MKIRFKKLVSHAVTPNKANHTDAAFDLVAIDMEYDPENDFVEYGTGLAVEIPEGCVGLLFPRSSVSKTPLILANCVGVIDSGYRGEIALRFKKLKEDRIEWEYRPGDRIGQLMIIKTEEAHWQEVEELDDSDRGTGGFGSSGK